MVIASLLVCLYLNHSGWGGLAFRHRLQCGFVILFVVIGHLELDMFVFDNTGMRHYGARGFGSMLPHETADPNWDNLWLFVVLKWLVYIFTYFLCAIIIFQ